MRESDSAYYAARAREYERIYSKPERQSELQALQRLIPSLFQGRNVLEVACGTCYWTQFIARSARSVCATDISEAMLRVARDKGFDAARVRLEAADATSLPSRLGRFNAAFCGFWWSHLSLGAIPGFLDSLHARLEPAATVVLLDNLYVEGSSTPISYRSPEGDTFQQRRLADGSVHEVLKNFPTTADLMLQLGGRVKLLTVNTMKYFWLAEYRSVE